MAGQLIFHTIPYLSGQYIPYFSSCNDGYLSDKCLCTPPTTPQKSNHLVCSIEQNHNGSRCCSLLPSMYRVFWIISFHINVERLLTCISASWWFMSHHRLDWFRKNCNGSEEMDSTEESIAGAAAIYLWLAPPRCSPAANMDIASNEISPILRPTNPQSH